MGWKARRARGSTARLRNPCRRGRRPAARGLLAPGVARPCPQGQAGHAWPEEMRRPGVERSRNPYRLSVRGRETSCSPRSAPTWGNQPGEASAWSQRRPAANRNSAVRLTAAKPLVLPLPRQRAGNTCFLPAAVMGKPSPQQLRYGSQTSGLQAAPATSLGRNRAEHGALGNYLLSTNRKSTLPARAWLTRGGGWSPGAALAPQTPGQQPLAPQGPRAPVGAARSAGTGAARGPPYGSPWCASAGTASRTS